MRRITSAVLVVLVAFGAFAAADALGPESVPVAGAVELHGEVPESGPPPSGFFIVPPRVIDMRDDESPARHEDADESDDDGDDGADDTSDTDDSGDLDDADDSDAADDADESDDESDDDGDDADD